MGKLLHPPPLEVPQVEPKKAETKTKHNFWFQRSRKSYFCLLKIILTLAEIVNGLQSLLSSEDTGELTGGEGGMCAGDH